MTETQHDSRQDQLSPDERAAEAPGPESGLERSVSAPLLMFAVVGAMVGGGIYALVGPVAGEVGGIVWLPFLAALLAAGFTAASYAELGTRYPQAGGAALYVRRGYGVPAVTFVATLAVLLSGVTSSAALMRSLADSWLPRIVQVGLPGPVVAAGALVLLGAVNAIGASGSLRANFILTVLALVGLALVVAAGIVTLAGGGGDPGAAFEFGGDVTSPVLATLGAASLAFYALIGFEDSANLAGEAENPRRTVPIALIGGLLLTGVVYMVVTVVTGMAVPAETLASQEGENALLAVLSGSSLPVPAWLVAALGLTALVNGALINMIMASRLVYGMAADGLLPRVLSSTGPREQPLVAIVGTTLLAMGLAFTGGLEVLASTTALLLLAVFALVNVAVIVIGRRGGTDGKDGQDGHLHVPRILPVLGALTCVGLATQQDPGVYLRAGGLVVIGVALWGATRLTRRLRE